MRRTFGRFDRTGESVRKDLASGRRLPLLEGVEHHVVAALPEGRTVPRTVESDEGAFAIARRELRALVENQRGRRPVSRKSRNGCTPLRAKADGLAAIATVFR